MPIDYQLIEGVSAAVTTAFTAGAAIYGIGSYQRSVKLRRLDELRTCTEEVSQILRAVDDELHDTNYYVTARETVSSLRAMYTGEPTAKGFAQWLTGVPDDIIVAATVDAQGRITLSSKVAQNFREAQTRIAGLTTAFPAVAHVLMNAVHLAGKGALPLVSTTVYRDFFNRSRGDFMGMILIQAERTDSLEEALRLFSLSLASVCSSLTSLREQRDFDAMERIVQEVSTWVKTEKDSTLNSLAAAAQKNAARIKRLDTPRYTDDIREGAKLLKPYLGKTRYELILQACDTLESDPQVDAWMENLVRATKPEDVLAILTASQAAGVPLPEPVMDKIRAVLAEQGIDLAEVMAHANGSNGAAQVPPHQAPPATAPSEAFPFAREVFGEDENKE